MNSAQLLSHFDRISDAPDAVPRLRRFILELAVRGKLVEQDLQDEPASYLLMRIQAENRQLEKAFHPLAEDEQPFTIPQSWEWIRLGNAVHVEMGQSPPSENYNQSGDGIPFYQGKTDFGLRQPTPRYWCDLPSKLAQKNDILISVRAPVGPTNVASEECCIGRGLAALRSHHGVYFEFLVYSLKGFESVIAAMGYGTTFVAITKKQLESFPVPLPPLAEQHRIVSKVDELMALCDRLEAAQVERENRQDRLVVSSLKRLNAVAEANAFRDHARFCFNHLPRLTTKPKHIQQLRKTILNLAIRGKLVPQDPSDEPASNLLKRIQAERDGAVKEGKIKKIDPVAPPSVLDFRSELPLGWEPAYLQSLCISVTDGDHLPPPKADRGIPFLVIGDVRSQTINFKHCRYVAEEYYDALDSIRRPKKGDVLYTLVGSYGIPIIVTDDHPFCVQRHIGILRPSKILSVAFLSRALESEWVFNQASACATGIAQKTVPLSGLRKILIPLPPLAEQQRIVAKVDELMALCDRLEAQLATTKTGSRRLLEALLHEALSERLATDV